MKAFINYPQENEKKEFLENLALFKTDLLIKSIESVSDNDQIKYLVLKKVIELLNEEYKDNFI